MLSQVDIGIYEYLIYIGSALSFFWLNGLLHGMLPVFPAYDPAAKRRFLFNSYLLFLGLTVLLCSLLLFGKDFIVPFFTGKSTLPFYYPFLLYLLLNLPTYVVEYFYLLNDRSRALVGWGATAFGAQLLAVLLPAFLGAGLEGSFYALIFVALLKHLWTWYLLSQMATFKLDWPQLNAYLRIALPLVLYALVSGFAQVFDNWLVGWYYQSEASFAIFRYGARELPLTTALTSGLGAAMIPILAKDFSAGLPALRQKALRLYHLLFPISIVLILWSEKLFPLVFNEDFTASAAVFNVYVLIMSSRLLFPQTVLVALKETKAILVISILEILLNILLSIYLVQSFGMVGIAIATVFAFLFEKIAIAIYLWQKFNIAIQRYTPLGWFSFYCAGLFAAYLWVSV